MVEEPTTFTIKFIRSPLKPKEAKTFNLSDVLGDGTCRIYSTHLEVQYLRQGWTKHLASMFGFLGFLLQPILGSLSSSQVVDTLQNKNIVAIKYDRSDGMISILALKDDDPNHWYYAFNCSDYQELLRLLATVTTVQGFDSSTPTPN